MSRPYTLADRVTMSTPDLRSPKRPRTAPTRFDGPPSSPPPTLPLPLPPISPSPASSMRLITPPPRPPRPQVSLPDLYLGSPSTPERIHKTVHFAARHTGQRWQPPSLPTTSIEPITITPLHGANPVVDSMDAELASPSNELNKDHRRSAGGRIWWSPSIRRARSSNSTMADSEMDAFAPPLPPRSVMRRSKRPPQKAVARSALHIPSKLAYEHVGSSHAHQVATPLQTESPFMLDEPITSLPSLPGAVQIERRACYQADASRPRNGDSEFSRPFRLSFTPLYFRNSVSRTSQSTADDRISFCAVTNLEMGAPDTKETASTAALAVGTDVVEQPAPTLWHQRYRRHIWAVVTIFAIVIGAGGMLTGIIWKLSHPTG